MTDNSGSSLHKKITSLTEMSVSGIDKLFEIAIRRQLSKGEVVLQYGKVCRNIIFVEKGYLRTSINKDGTIINTDFAFEGDFTTNLKSLRTSTVSETTIDAGEPTIIYEFDKDKLLELYKVS